MSNIFGLVRLCGKDIDHIEIDNMAQGAERLGSASNQIFIEQNVFLGFKPFLLTPQDRFENQPLKSLDNRFIMVADARYDDRESLLKKLGYSGREGERLSDGQLSLEAFLKWGEYCTDHLMGDFALVVYDRIKRSLWVARDHIGAAPLYYAYHNGYFAFASLPLPIISLKMIGKRVNLAQVMAYLSGADVLSHQTQYESVNELPAAHHLSVTAQKLKLKEYWQVPMRESNLGSIEEYAEALLELTERAIADRMRIEGHVSSFLSGGLDSSTTSCILARKLQKSGEVLPTYTYVPLEGYREDKYPGRFVNERPYVEEIAQFQPGINTYFLDLKGASVFDNLEDLLDISGGLNVHGYYNRLWAEKILGMSARDGHKAVFDAMVGNITLSTTGLGYYTELAAKGKYITFLKEIKHHGRTHNRPLWRDALSFGVLPFIPADLRQWLESKRYTGIYKIPFVKEGFAKKYNPDQYFMLQDKFVLRHDRQKRLRTLQYTQRSTPIKRAWETMFGTRQIDPTMDKRLVEFSFQVPLKHFVHRGNFRHLIRTATDGLLPERVRWNYKKGLQLADEKALFDSDVETFISLISNWKNDSTIKEFIDLDRMISFLTSSKNSPEALAMRIFFTKMIVCGVFIERNN